MEKIVVVGMGYVGLANAVLLAQHNQVTAIDLLEEKVRLINERRSPVNDEKIKEFFNTKQLHLRAATDIRNAFKEADYIIIATPTDYDPDKQCFDTKSVDSLLNKICAEAPNVCVIIKSTVPIGYTNRMRERYGTDRILFSPEFLREGKALHDNLYPSRIVIGGRSEKAKRFSELMLEGAIKKEVSVIYTGCMEAEAIKLFSNTFLAMRVAFFNELDTFAETRGLNSKEIIHGISLDSRIGDYYNNPSFGYGGYCLPKDTKQLLAHYDQTPNRLVTAIVNSNEVRKDYIASQILSLQVATAGIYRLIMKTGSDNFRYSSMLGIIRRIREKGVRVVIYEPICMSDTFLDIEVTRDIQYLKAEADIILANRWNKELCDVKHKVYTRDVFGRD